MSEIYEELRRKTFSRVQKKLLENITDKNLLRIFSEPEWETGVIRRCDQETVHKFFPLVAHKEWELRYAYFADEDNMYYSFDGSAPVFLDVDAYLDYQELRKDKVRFEKEWRDHRFIRSHRDCEMFDGNAQIWFNNRYPSLPKAADERQEKHKKRKNLKPDEVAIILRTHAASNALTKFEKEHLSDYGTVFVLAPVADTENERKLIVAKHFKDVVINRYARYLMSEYDKKVIDDWSQKVLNGSIESKVRVTKYTTDDLYDMIIHQY